MSDNRKTVKDLEIEYGTLCAKAGDLAYKIEILREQLSLTHEQLKAVNLEAANLEKEQGNK